MNKKKNTFLQKFCGDFFFLPVLVRYLPTILVFLVFIDIDITKFKTVWIKARWKTIGRQFL